MKTLEFKRNSENYFADVEVSHSCTFCCECCCSNGRTSIVLQMQSRCRELITCNECGIQKSRESIKANKSNNANICICVFSTHNLSHRISKSMPDRWQFLCKVGQKSVIRQLNRGGMHGKVTETISMLSKCRLAPSREMGRRML